ncbi:MAG: hypothetical protein DRR19_13900 [Candidatus Parabeggiatoa sp. nov. 1]|nr:MAG: hypothetical protein DRR19_13900 [Gammaproteobacteria bacterium]
MLPHTTSFKNLIWELEIGNWKLEIGKLGISSLFVTLMKLYGSSLKILKFFFTLPLKFCKLLKY